MMSAAPPFRAHNYPAPALAEPRKSGPCREREHARCPGWVREEWGRPRANCSCACHEREERRE
jgi:hypothetical protein